MLGGFFRCIAAAATFAAGTASTRTATARSAIRRCGAGRRFGRGAKLFGVELAVVVLIERIEQSLAHFGAAGRRAEGERSAGTKSAAREGAPSARRRTLPPRRGAVLSSRTTAEGVRAESPAAAAVLLGAAISPVGMLRVSVPAVVPARFASMVIATFVVSVALAANALALAAFAVVAAFGAAPAISAVVLVGPQSRAAGET